MADYIHIAKRPLKGMKSKHIVIKSKGMSKRSRSTKNTKGLFLVPTTLVIFFFSI